MRGHIFGKLGIGITSVLFISRWMSTNAMFTVSETTVKYGIIAGQLFALMGALAFFVFGFIGKKARELEQDRYSLMDFVTEKIDNKTKTVLFLLMGFGYGLDLLLLAVGASIILYATILLPPTLGVFVFIVIGLSLFFLKTHKDYGKYTVYKIGIFQSVMIIIVVFLFLRSNMEDMYFNMKLFHPYLFSFQKQELVLLSLSVFVIFLGKLVIDLGSWSLLLRVKKGKIGQSLLLTGLMWASIPLTFSIIMFPVLSQGGFNTIYTLYHDLLVSFHSDFLLLLTAVTILLTLISTYYTRLQDFISLLEMTKINQQKKSAVLMTVGCIGLLLGAYYYFQPNLLELFFFSGILSSSLLLPILFLIFSKKKKQDRITIVTILTGILTGFSSIFLVPTYVSVLTPILISLLLLGLWDRVWDRGTGTLSR